MSGCAEPAALITLAPVVTDARFAVHDQRVDLQLSEASCNRKPCLTSADNEDGRFAVDILGSGFPEVEPVGALKIARVDLVLGT